MVPTVKGYCAPPYKLVFAQNINQYSFLALTVFANKSSFDWNISDEQKLQKIQNCFHPLLIKQIVAGLGQGAYDKPKVFFCVAYE